MVEPTEGDERVRSVDKVEVIGAQNRYMIQQTEYMQNVFELEQIDKMKLATDLLDIVYDTELPEHFDVVDITSTTNTKVKSKYEAITKVPELQNIALIPSWMTQDYPITEEFDENTLKKAPWVNDIHAWMKVLNCANTLSAIQRNIVESEEVIGAVASIAEELYSFTTESDRKVFLRTSNQFDKQEKFPETTQRENGTEAINSSRHVSLSEMKYILQTMKKSFAKNSF